MSFFLTSSLGLAPTVLSLGDLYDQAAGEIKTDRLFEMDRDTASDNISGRTNLLNQSYATKSIQRFTRSDIQDDIQPEQINQTTIETIEQTSSSATDSRDIIQGTDGNDDINALGGNDVIHGSMGDDLIDGGAGRDLLIYSKPITDYDLIKIDNQTLAIIDQQTGYIDRVIEIELFSFSGTIIPFDEVMSQAGDGSIPDNDTDQSDDNTDDGSSDDSNDDEDQPPVDEGGSDDDDSDSVDDGSDDDNMDDDPVDEDDKPDDNNDPDDSDDQGQADDNTDNDSDENDQNEDTDDTSEEDQHDESEDGSENNDSSNDDDQSEGENGSHNTTMTFTWNGAETVEYALSDQWIDIVTSRDLGRDTDNPFDVIMMVTHHSDKLNIMMSPFNSDAPDRIEIDTDGANDYINVAGFPSTEQHFTFRTGDGDDVIGVRGLKGDDFVFAGAGDDVVRTGAGRDSILLEEGNDTAYGGKGADQISGGQGDDTIYGQGGRDILNGGQGDDILNGGGGKDALFGGEGNDVITGGAGMDIMFGDSGNDTFVFAAANGNDEIKDFSAGAGSDDVVCR